MRNGIAQSVGDRLHWICERKGLQAIPEEPYDLKFPTDGKSPPVFWDRFEEMPTVTSGPLDTGPVRSPTESTHVTATHDA